jgi:hypothetical protein
VFWLFGTTKALFLEVVGSAFDQVCDGMLAAATASRRRWPT